MEKISLLLFLLLSPVKNSLNRFGDVENNLCECGLFLTGILVQNWK